MRKTIDFNNFTYQQISQTKGLKEKIKKILNDRFDGAKLAYCEVNYVDVSKETLYVFVIQTNWTIRYFKLNTVNFSKRISERLTDEIEYAELSENKEDENFLDKLLQKETLEKTDSSELEEVDAEKNQTNLTRYDKAFRELSLSMQGLIIGNDFEVEEAEGTLFDVTLKSFIYEDLEKIVSPIVKRVVPSSNYFKILDRTDSSLDILIVTKDATLYQFRITVTANFKKLMNKYINLIPYDQKSVVLKKSCMDAKNNQIIPGIPEDQRGILNVIRKMTFDGKLVKVDPFTFAKFAFEKTNSAVASGYKVDGSLKNVYDFFRATSKDDNECRMKILRHFRESSTFSQKEQLEYRALAEK